MSTSSDRVLAWAETGAASEAPAIAATGAGANPARELVAALWRGKRTILLVWALVSGAVALGVLCAPPLFEAEASLIVRLGREYVYRPETGRPETARMPSLAEMVNSEVEILSGRGLAEQVVRELGVARLYPALLEDEPDPELVVERAVLRFRGATSVRPVLDSGVIKVGFEHAVPERAAEAVNQLLEHFEAKHVQVFGEEHLSDVEAQLAARTAERTRAEEELAELQRRSEVFDLEEQERLLLGQRARLQEELQARELELAALRSAPDADEEPTAAVELPQHLSPDMKGELLRQRGEIERELRALDSGTPDRLIEEASLRLLDLRLEEQRLLRDFSESNRRVQGVRAEIEEVRTFLAGAERRAGELDELRRGERAERAKSLQAESARLSDEIELLLRAERQAERERLRTLALQRDGLARRLAQLDVDLAALGEHAKNLRRLQRALGAAEAAEATCAQRVAEARIAEEMDREKRINVRVIDAASAPVVPLGLPRSMKLFLGGFVGLISGAGLAVLLDSLRRR